MQDSNLLRKRKERGEVASPSGRTGSRSDWGKADSAGRQAGGWVKKERGDLALAALDASLGA